MAGLIGMEPEAANALAAKMNSTAQMVQGEINKLTSQVDSVAWKGPDADKFKSEWKGTCVKAINNVVQVLQQKATELKRQAADQTATSSH